MTEEWKDVQGYEGKYQISNSGNLRSVFNGFIRERKNLDNGHGYRYAMLKGKSKPKNMYIHRMVAQAFIPNEFSLPEVNHIDGDKNNNHIDNLEWVTSSENTQHGIREGLIPQPPGRHAMAINKKTGLITTAERVSDLARILSLPRTHISHVLCGKVPGKKLAYEVAYL